MHILYHILHISFHILHISFHILHINSLLSCPVSAMLSSSLMVLEAGHDCRMTSLPAPPTLPPLRPLSAGPPPGLRRASGPEGRPAPIHPPPGWSGAGQGSWHPAAPGSEREREGEREEEREPGGGREGGRGREGGISKPLGRYV